MNTLSHTVTMARMARSLLVPGLVWASLLAQAQPVSPPTAPAPPPATSQPTPALGVAAQQEARCRAQWAAYAQSQRCFNACGATGREGARNNAACGHCTDTPMPACDPPASGN